MHTFTDDILRAFCQFPRGHCISEIRKGTRYIRSTHVRFEVSHVIRDNQGTSVSQKSFSLRHYLGQSESTHDRRHFKKSLAIVNVSSDVIKSGVMPMLISIPALRLPILSNLSQTISSGPHDSTQFLGIYSFDAQKSWQVASIPPMCSVSNCFFTSPARLFT